MASIFGRIARAVLGKQVYDPKQKRADREAKAAAERQRVAGRLAARAGEAESMARRQAAQAHHVLTQAQRTGNVEAARQARAAERDALDFAARQRQERLDQERRERDAKHEAEQAVIKREQNKAQAREALLRTRKRLKEEGRAWPFAGPAPKAPKLYKNINSGAGDLPDEQSFLMGQKYTAFASSNVVAIQFDPRGGGDLYIQYKKKGWYRYVKVGQAFALHMYNVGSKGIAVHDEIRVRGENMRLPSPPASTRKTFQRGVSPPSDLPLTSSAAAFGAGGGGI